MSRDDCQPLLNEFRQHLEDFYAVLNLAPPYHSIEQAIVCLSALTDAKTDDQRQQLLVNPILRRELYGQAFTDSGLHKKTSWDYRQTRPHSRPRGGPKSLAFLIGTFSFLIVGHECFRLLLLTKCVIFATVLLIFNINVRNALIFR